MNITFPPNSDVSECGRYEVGPAGTPVRIDLRPTLPCGHGEPCISPDETHCVRCGQPC